ncbi:MAG: RidA family protein [Flavobacteriaceae bacterium]|nr:RidA family protein [Flavobacteriaceae bacterium]
MPFLFLLLVSCANETKNSTATQALYDYDVEERIISMGIELKQPTLPKGIKIEFAVKSGNQIYLSGNGPRDSKGNRIVGKVGTDLTIEQGYEAARLTAINHIAILKNELGDLNKVVRIVKVLGMVNAESTFTQQPAVINGYTDLMIEVFGDRGRHARSAVGMASLPWDMACEVEAIVEVLD